MIPRRLQRLTSFSIVTARPALADDDASALFSDKRNPPARRPCRDHCADHSGHAAGKSHRPQLPGRYGERGTVLKKYHEKYHAAPAPANLSGPFGTKSRSAIIAVEALLHRGCVNVA